MKQIFEEPATFLVYDQPTTCGHCNIDSRSEMLGNFRHTNLKITVELCLNPACNKIFFEQEDEYFLAHWMGT